MDDDITQNSELPAALLFSLLPSKNIESSANMSSTLGYVKRKTTHPKEKKKQVSTSRSVLRESLQGPCMSISGVRQKKVVVPGVPKV